MFNINWESPWVWAVIILGCVSLAAHAALFAAIGLLLYERAKVKVHKGAQQLSTFLKGIGCSVQVTQPLDDLASGDRAAAIADGLKEAQYLLDAANRAKELRSITSTAMADPVVGPPFKKWLTDLLAGASSDVLDADATDVVNAVHGKASSQLDLVNHLDQLTHTIEVLQQNGGLTAGSLANLFSGNATTAPIQGFLMKLASLGQQIVPAAAPAVAKTAAVVSAAVPVAAPVAVPVAAAAAGVAAGMKTVTVTVPSDHIVTSAPPPVAATTVPPTAVPAAPTTAA